MKSDSINILFYYPSNKRTIAMETLLKQLDAREGYHVMGLTTCEKGDLHKELESHGISFTTHVVAATPRILYYIKQLVFLIRFCRKHNIHYVHAHLQQVNIIAVFAQYFISAKVIIFRHHFQYLKNSSYTEKVNRMQRIFDSVINRLAKVIVVPSSGVKAGMVEEEGVRESKVVILPYLYDFSKYSKPNSVAVAEIQKAYPARLRLIMVSRLVKLKQHHVVFPVIQELISEGMDIKLLVLDEGPEEAHLKSWIVEHKMEEYIFMLGFRRDFIDYMAACDVLVQPSLTDASNSVAKEMALMEKVIIVTERVGDYSDYVVDGQNGFLIPKSNPQDKIKAIIREIYHGNGKYHKLGVKLREDVVGLFGSEKNQKAINSYFDLMD